MTFYVKDFVKKRIFLKKWAKNKRFHLFKKEKKIKKYADLCIWAIIGSEPGSHQLVWQSI